METNDRTDPKVAVMDVSDMPCRLMDDGTAERFLAKVGQFMNDGSHNLVANMIECRNLDETGVKALIQAREIARRNGGDLVLANVCGRTRKTLAQIPEAADIQQFGSEEAAKQSFNETRNE